MLKKNLTTSMVAVLLVTTMFSCKKSLNEALITTQSSTKQAIPAFPLNWESIDYMPSPPGEPPILVPWASGSNQLFAPEQALDFKKSDGWELVYNTFSSTQPSALLFFSLYNKYRGLMRFYIYNPPGVAAPSSYLTDGLAISGSSNSSIINFSTPVSDIDNPTRSVTRIQNFSLQSTGSWYISQFEVAYDPNIPNTSYQDLNFVWSLASTSVTDVNLNGETSGTLTGTIGSGSAGGFNPGGLLNNTAKGTLYAAGLSALNSLKANKSNIFTSIITGLKGGLSGAVSGIISAIIGGTPTSPQMVDLKMESEIKLTGTFSTGSGIASPTLVIPGSNNSQNGTGYVPAYNENLGVFNFVNSPNFNFNVSYEAKPFFYSVHPIQGGIRHIYTHTFQKASIYATLNINPLLTTNGATVEILRQDILIPYSPQTSPTSILLKDNLSIDIPGGTYSGTEEILGTNYIVADITNLSSFKVTFSAVSNTNKLQYDKSIVRYTLKITPPNNGEPITIIRSLQAKLI